MYINLMYIVCKLKLNNSIDLNLIIYNIVLIFI